MMQGLLKFSLLTVLPFLLFTGRGFSQALPIWAGSFIDSHNGNQYQFNMVGTDPSQTNITTDIPTYIVPVNIVFDASDNSSVCGTAPVPFDADNTVLWDGEPLITNVEQSPMFTPISGFPEQGAGGPLQYIDAFQRGNFWEYVSTQLHANYHLVLSPVTVLPELAFTVVPRLGEAVNGNTQPNGGHGGCVGAVGEGYIQSQFSLAPERTGVATASPG